MRILVLSFYFPPDLSAGSFRAKALVHHLKETLPKDSEIDVITTLPNRFKSYATEANQHETQGNVCIYRLDMPEAVNGFVHQSRIFISYAKQASRLIKGKHYDLIYATSSKLFTATLAAWFSRRKNAKLYLDIRDIFVDTVKDVVTGPLGKLSTPAFSVLEKWTLRRAHQVNLVSPGFNEYFSRRYPQKDFKYFTNGIDPEVLQMLTEPPQRTEPKILQVLYAGTLGEGQGLDLIVPELAQLSKHQIQFKIIGDGARKVRLEEKLRRLGCENVLIQPPIERDKLMQAYLEADVLFLHLNKQPAFLKVLPSKLFEYAATGKPIWAGIAGYAAQFTQQEIPNSAVFDPTNASQAMTSLEKLSFSHTPRSAFVSKYLRTEIMQSMAEDILRVAKES